MYGTSARFLTLAITAVGLPPALSLLLFRKEEPMVAHNMCTDDTKIGTPSAPDYLMLRFKYI